MVAVDECQDRQDPARQQCGCTERPIIEKPKKMEKKTIACGMFVQDPEEFPFRPGGAGGGLISRAATSAVFFLKPPPWLERIASNCHGSPCLVVVFTRLARCHRRTACHPYQTVSKSTEYQLGVSG